MNRQWPDRDIRDDLAAIFGSVVADFGYAYERGDWGLASFRSAAARIEVKYVPREGDVSVLLFPNDGESLVDVKLYLEKVDPELKKRLGRAVESDDEAVALAVDTAEAVPLAAGLLRCEEPDLTTARSLRWWSDPL